MNIFAKWSISTSAIGMAALFFAQTALAGPIGWSVMSDGDDHLYEIDLLTGHAADLGLVGATGPTGFGDAEGLAVVGSELYAIGGTAGQLWNITEPPGEKIGNTGIRLGTEAGLDYDQTTGALYNYQGGFGRGALYSIDLTSGGATLVGINNQFADGLAFDRAGNAFVIDGIFTDSLYRLDLSTASVSVVGKLGFDSNVSFGLSFDDFGTLWGLNKNGDIFQLSTETGMASYIANVTFNGDRLANFEGLAVKPVLEPTSIVLLGAGLAGLGVVRRRQGYRGV